MVPLFCLALSVEKNSQKYIKAKGDFLGNNNSCYCKATYFPEGFIFANLQILGAARKLNDVKTYFLYHRIDIFAKLKPSQ